MGILVNAPAQIVQRMLIGLGQGADPDVQPLGLWPVYYDREPSTPDECVTIYDTTADDDGDEMLEGEKCEHPGIMLRVRSRTPQPGYAKARALAVFLSQSIHLSTISINGTAYTVQSVLRKGGVIRAGKEPESQRNIYTINANITVDRD